ncbi:MAG: hypothetical protein JOZ92_00585, partial [Candidatus Dormibacteraeota bacterium]|nr:hypothetical protein [Candidatus Dormibacteraeota bacterium]
QSTQGTQPAKPSPQPQRAKAAAAAAPPPDEMWSRQSYAVLIGFLAVLEVVITALQWAFAPATSSGVPKAPLWEYVVFLNPISLLVASVIAPFGARYVTHERRALRPIESIVVGLVAYFVSTFVTFGVGALVGASAANSSGSPTATPCPASTTCVASPAASASASPTATASPHPSPSASASASASANPVHSIASNAGSQADLATATLRPEETAGFVAGDVITFVITLFVYPPLYKRLRIKRPPPGSARTTRAAGRSKPEPAKAVDAKSDASGNGDDKPKKRRAPWP